MHLETKELLNVEKICRDDILKLNKEQLNIIIKIQGLNTYCFGITGEINDPDRLARYKRVNKRLITKSFAKMEALRVICNINNSQDDLQRRWSLCNSNLEDNTKFHMIDFEKENECYSNHSQHDMINASKTPQVMIPTQKINDDEKAMLPIWAFKRKCKDFGYWNYYNTLIISIY
jgi:hypothetical protein